MPPDKESITQHFNNPAQQEENSDNPWEQVLYQRYNALLTHGTKLITLVEQKDLDEAKSTLADLKSFKMKTYLQEHPGERTDMMQREKETIACIEKNELLITSHNEKLQAMRDQLIHRGFLDPQGNPIANSAQ